MTVADFNGPQPETVLACIEELAVSVTKFHDHTIEGRMVEVPQLRVLDRQFELNRGGTWNSCNGCCFGLAYDGSARRVGGGSYLKVLLVSRNVVEEYVSRDLSLVRCDRTCNPLAAD